MKRITKTELTRTDKLTPAAKKWALSNLDYLNTKNPKLLGTSVKIEKGNSETIHTVVVYLQPADKVSARTLCKQSEFAGCKKDCLITSGHLGMTAGQNAATRRTILMLLRRAFFFSKLSTEINRAARKKNLLVRLNGTSDIDFTHFIAAHPHINFYDYSKDARRVNRNTLKNYDLTYSGSAASKQAIRATARMIKAKHRVAIALNTKELTGEFKRPSTMADFDKDDLRPKDAKILGALKSKGTNKQTRAEINASSNHFFYTEKTLIQLQNLL